MLLPRIIPVLLMRDRGLVKTQKFLDAKYVGDPINAVRIYNEKEADELITLDIDASAKGREPDYELIARLAAESRMPLCYGGGIKSVKQAKKVLSLGVEKIAVSSLFFENPELVRDMISEVGSQSVVVVLDVKRKLFGAKQECLIYNGTKSTGVSAAEAVSRAEKMGVGELVVNSIDNDGVMDGYDLKLIHNLKSKVSIPFTALGGAGSYQHMKNLIDQEGIVGAAAGSLFVFKGKYRAVLITYPDPEDKNTIFNSIVG